MHLDFVRRFLCVLQQEGDIVDVFCPADEVESVDGACYRFFASTAKSTVDDALNEYCHILQYSGFQWRSDLRDRVG